MQGLCDTAARHTQKKQQIDFLEGDRMKLFENWEKFVSDTLRQLGKKSATEAGKGETIQEPGSRQETSRRTGGK